MSVVPIRKAKSTPTTKQVEANQKSVDALPLNSGMWKVENETGLYVRCRAKSRSFMLQRRREGDLVKVMLGPITLKAAKEEARKQWGTLEPRAASEVSITLGAAIDQYIEAKTAAGKMGETTAALARYNKKQYLDPWKDRGKDRTLAGVGADRLGIRLLQQRITAKHGAATSNQVVRLLAAVYRWFRDVDDTLPEWSKKAAELHKIKPRDWAYSDEELRAWWYARTEKAGKVTVKGVRTLGPIKRAWWLTALLTGARKGSIEALRWKDLDFEKKVIRFRVTKGDRPYDVPMSDTLSELLQLYRDGEDVPPSDWVFPSTVIDDAHIKDVKNPKEGVGPAHRLRHTFRTTLATLGVSSDQARMLMGHSLMGDVSRGYITTALVLDSLRPITNAVSAEYMKIIGPGAFSS